MFEIKITEKNGKKWQFNLVANDQYELWINSSGDDSKLWVHNGTLSLIDTMVKVAELLGKNR